MDQEWLDLIKAKTGGGTAGGQDRQTADVQIVFADPVAGRIEIVSPGEPAAYTLKPLAGLYGRGVNAETIDPQSDDYLPLLLAIEESIIHYFGAHADLTDSQVLSMLERLAMKPEMSVEKNPPAAEVQMSLRLLLSAHDYSRWDVQRALRKIIKSVQRHARDAGPRSYLRFIRAHLP